MHDVRIAPSPPVRRPHRPPTIRRSILLGDDEAAGRLVLFCERIGEPLDRGLASRRYVLSGDRRALHGTVL
ncbi:hypothetical protein [Streptomyces sp. NPDC050485]|uniref:hypothetical protein n=1 Tax=Streptomyces sp. NPDC050485 TaxID=3365617 RepID=UPI0037B5CC5D